MRRLALAAASLLALGCPRGPEPIHVVSLSVADGAVEKELRAEGIEAESLGAAARSALVAAGFRAGAGSRPHRALLVLPSARLLPPIAGDGRTRAEVTAEIVLAPDERDVGPPLRESASAAVPLPVTGPPRDAWLAAIAHATGRAAEGLALAVAAAEKPEKELIADISAQDARVREHAIRVLGERRSRAAVALLIERLSEEEPRIAHRIVGTLAQIGDERAVPALIDVSRAGDPSLTARVARYIGDIGGAEAEGYLLTLAAGHPDRRVRAAASEALGEMRARAKEAALAATK